MIKKYKDGTVRNLSHILWIAKGRMEKSWQEYWTKNTKHYTREELREIFSIDDKTIKKYKLAHLRAQLDNLYSKKTSLLKEISSGGSSQFISPRIQAVLKEIEKKREEISFYERVGTSKIPHKDIPLSEVKKIPIKRILELAGIKIERGNFFKVRNENTPSANFNPDKNVFLDFGSQEGGSVIDLYMKIHNCDVSQAVKELRKLI